MQFKASLFNKVFALLCIAISFVLIINFNAAHNWLIEYSSSNILEEEEVMNPRRIAILKIGLALTISLAISLAIGLLLNLPQKIYTRLNRVIDTERMTRIFFLDDLMPSGNFAIKSFIFSSAFAIIIHLRQLIFGDDVKEDIFEHISEVLFLLSALLFFLILFYLKHLNVSRKQRRIIKYLFLVFGFGLLFVFLEEISYGQHIFKWKSTGIFETHNFQEETNFHNFINPFYRFLYPLFGFGLFGVCSILWFFNKDEGPMWLTFLTPHKSLIILTLFMAASTYKGHSESFEHLFSLFMCLYVLRLLLYLKTVSLKNTTHHA